MTEHQFRSVMRGYDPHQVEQVLRDLSGALDAARSDAAQSTVAVSKLEATNAELLSRLEQQDAHVQQLSGAAQEAERRATAPTFADLGERIGHILTLADEEAASIRGTAQEDAAGVRLGASTEADAIRAEADRYAEQTRSSADTDAARILEDARTRADDIIDQADREASALREEAEALLESQRAKAASAAADFETTLAARRDKAAADFREQLATQESTLTAAQERADTLTADASRTLGEAKAEATELLEKARAEARTLVTSAREQAERVKRDSDRELAALASRRDSITAQLGNVRQMLATLGGGALAGGLPDQPAPATDAPTPEATADATPEATVEATPEATVEATPGPVEGTDPEPTQPEVEAAVVEPLESASAEHDAPQDERAAPAPDEHEPAGLFDELPGHREPSTTKVRVLGRRR